MGGWQRRGARVKVPSFTSADIFMSRLFMSSRLICIYHETTGNIHFFFFLPLFLFSSGVYPDQRSRSPVFTQQDVEEPASYGCRCIVWSLAPFLRLLVVRIDLSLCSLFARIHFQLLPLVTSRRPVSTYSPGKNDNKSRICSFIDAPASK